VQDALLKRYGVGCELDKSASFLQVPTWPFINALFYVALALLLLSCFPLTVCNGTFQFCLSLE